MYEIYASKDYKETKMYEYKTYKEAYTLYASIKGCLFCAGYALIIKNPKVETIERSC